MSRARLLRPEGTWWGQRCSSGSRTRTWVPEVSFGRLRLRDSWGSRLELQQVKLGLEPVGEWLIGVPLTDLTHLSTHLFQLKWCAWVAVYCSFISFANSRSSEDTKQMMSSFM